MKKWMLTLIFLFSGLNATLHAQISGDLDSSFGTNGLVQLSFDTIQSWATKVLVLPDQRILACGYTHHTVTGTNSEMVYTRLMPDGNPDISFGNNGKAYGQIPYPASRASSIALYPNLDFLAAGHAKIGNKQVGALVRYLSNGLIDTTFGTGGLVSFDLGNYSTTFTCLRILSNGKILLAGNWTDGVVSNSTPSMLVVRCHANGSIDSSFGQNGIVHDLLGADAIELLAMDVLSDGSILVGGEHELAFLRSYLLVKLTANGIPDSAFGNAGVIITQLPGLTYNRVNYICTDPAGSIYAGGNSNNTLTALKFNPNGSPDTGYGNAGHVVCDHGCSDIGFDALYDPEFGLLIGGAASIPAGQASSFILVNYTDNGIPDSNFSQDGKSYRSFPPNAEIYSLAMQHNDKIIAAGITNHKYFTIARYHRKVAPLQVTQLSNLQDIKVYPNPGRGTLVLEGKRLPMQHHPVTLSNLQGQIIFSTQAIQAEKILLDVSQVPAGIYLIKVGTWEEKIVLE